MVFDNYTPNFTTRLIMCSAAPVGVLTGIGLKYLTADMSVPDAILIDASIMASEMAGIGYALIKAADRRN